MDAIETQKETFKRVAVSALLNGYYDGFLQYHFMSNYVSLDYKYSVVDEDFNAFVQLAAERHPLRTYVSAKCKQPIKEGTIKVGIILEGFSSIQAPIQQYRTLAKFNDRFDLYYYSRIPMHSNLAIKEHYADVVAELIRHRCEVRCATENMTPMHEVRFLADAIMKDGIDLMIYQTLYFIPQFNFLSHLWPAFFQCSTTHQQPEYCRHMDCVNTLKTYEPYQVVECNPYLLSMDKNPDEKPHSRSEFDIPEDAVVIVSVARSVKYDKEFWKEIGNVLSLHDNVVFIPIGFNGEPPISPKAKSKTIIVGYREDVVSFYKMADIYFDMFSHTSGALMEAAYFGVPGVTKKRKPMGATFDVENQDIASEFIPDTNLSLERLIADPEYRKQSGENFRKFASQFEPREAVKRFTQSLEEKFWRKAKANENLLKMCV